MTCPHAYSDGAYVLGALNPAERTTDESHLSGCASCSAAVARLAPLPGLLGRVELASLEPAPETTRVSKLLAAVTQLRHRQVRVRRWQLAGAVLAAAVLAVVGTGLAYTLTEQDPPATEEPSLVAMRAVEDWVPITAQVSVTPVVGGTAVHMECQYPAQGDGASHVYWLVAVGEDGSTESLGSWSAGPGEDASLSSLTRYTDDLARLELRGEGGTTLLTYP